ncbi:MAG: LysR family transcriptional regulator [Pseudomonadota bacterium]
MRAAARAMGTHHSTISRRISSLENATGARTVPCSARKRNAFKSSQS